MIEELDARQKAIMTAEFMRCWPWLEKAVARNGPTHTMEDVLADVMSGKAQLWPGPDAAMVTTISDHPTGFKEIVGWLAGGSMSGVLKLEEQAAIWASEIGCNRVVLICREGFRKTMAQAGYKQKQIVLVKELA